MTTFNIDTAAAVARLERVGFGTEQAREIVDIVAEADAEHVTKADFRILEQQLKTGFANVETTMARIETTIAQALLRGVGIVLGGLAVATAILLTLG